MSAQLHIELKPDVVDPAEEVLEGFPFDLDQTILSHSGGIIIVDLAAADDTNYVQDWYLNENDDVLGFFVVED